MAVRRNVRGLSLQGGEILSALALLAVCAYAWIESAGFISRSGLVQTLSPALFPRILIVGLALCAVGVIVRAWARRAAPVDVGWGHLGRLVLAIGVMFLQVLLFDRVGALPSAWIGLFLLLLVAGVRWLTALMVATGFLVFVYVFFILLLRVPLPTGLLPTGF